MGNPGQQRGTGKGKELKEDRALEGPQGFFLAHLLLRAAATGESVEFYCCVTSIMGGCFICPGSVLRACFHGTRTRIRTALHTYLHPHIGTDDVRIFLWGECDLRRLSSCYDICLLGEQVCVDSSRMWQQGLVRC